MKPQEDTLDGLPATSDAPADEPVRAGAPLAGAAADSQALRRARRRAALVGLGLLGLAVALTVGVLVDRRAPWVQPADDAWLRWTVQHRTAWLTDAARALDRLGSPLVTAPVRLLVCVALVLRRRWLQLAAFATAIVLSELAIGPLKALVDRPRPPGPLVATSGASFPSGHAVAAAVTAFGIVIAVLPRGRRRLRWTLVATVVAGSMAWSRTYLAAHWSSDTVAGVCIGTAVALLTEVAFESGRTIVATRRRRIGVRDLRDTKAEAGRDVAAKEAAAERARAEAEAHEAEQRAHQQRGPGRASRRGLPGGSRRSSDVRRGGAPCGRE